MTNDQEYTDVMVDLETTGVSPDRTAILQVSAVKFNLSKGTVCPQFFDRCMSMPGHRFWDESTRNWWAKQKPAVLRDILMRQEPCDKVLIDLANWARQNPTITFWSKPTTFDFTFLQSYYNDIGVISPFHFRRCKDMRSFLDGLYYEQGGLADGYEGEVEFVGEAHNALADTLHQLKVLFHFVNKKGNLNADSQDN